MTNIQKLVLAGSLVVVAMLQTAGVANALTSQTELRGTAGDAQNTLSWDLAVTDGKGTGATQYTLFHNTTAIYTGTELTFTHRNLTNGTSYTYSVTSNDGSGSSPSSNTVILKPAFPNDGYILDAPFGNTYLKSNRWCAVQSKSLTWADSLKTCDTGGGAIPSFDPNKSSYVIFKLNQENVLTNPTYTPTNGQPKFLKLNRYRLLMSANPNVKLTAYKNADGQYYVTSSGPIIRAQIIAEPKDDIDYKYNGWANDSTAFQTTDVATFDPASSATFKGYVVGNDVYSAQVSAINIDYASSWNYARFNDSVQVGTSDNNGGCSLWDVGCVVGNAFANLSNTFQDLVVSIVKGISSMWIPNPANIQKSFDNTTTFFKTKLGFLYYPVEFTSNLFNAFKGTGGQSCANNACMLTFGNFFGKPFQLEVSSLQRTAPQIWTWVQLLLQGLTAMAVVFMFRRKLLKVMSQ